MRHAHQHCILHRITKGWSVRLGNIGNHACHFALRNAARLAAIQQDPALILAQYAQDAAEQRALAHAIGAKDG